MGNLVIEKIINAPIERVYEHLIDLEHWPENIEGITNVEKHTEGPVRDGTEFSETRVMFGKPHTERMTFAGVTPNQGYTLVCNSCGVHYESAHTLTPEGGKTKLRMEMTSKPTTLVARLMSPMGLLMKGTMTKMIQKDFDDLARACEQDANETESA